MLNSESFDPVIVVGPGRSGTTVVARLLHEEMGIDMGEKFRSDPEGKCYFEDLDFRDLNRHFMDGRLSFNEWLQATERNVFVRKTAEKPWGFKDPRASYIMGLYLMLFNDPLFVRCRRNHEDVARSMSKNYGWPIVKALNMAKERDLALDRYLWGRKVVGLYFDEWQDEGRLCAVLKEHLDVYNDGRRLPGVPEVLRTLESSKDISTGP